MTLPASTDAVIEEVAMECARQDVKWGEQNHSPAQWFAILMEEVGEAAREIVGLLWPHVRHDPENYRTELIQTAAVAIRMVESFDRNEAQELSFGVGRL